MKVPLRCAVCLRLKKKRAFENGARKMRSVASSEQQDESRPRATPRNEERLRVNVEGRDQSTPRRYKSRTRVRSGAAHGFFGQNGRRRSARSRSLRAKVSRGPPNAHRVRASIPSSGYSWAAASCAIAKAALFFPPSFVTSFLFFLVPAVLAPPPPPPFFLCA